MVMNEQQLKQYFSREWIGTVKGQYENVCHLRFEEIPNFIRYAGMYADLEIFDSHESEFLLDTYGPFVNRIWPDLSSSQREQYRDIINQIASHINAEFENIAGEPIEKVKVFIDQIQAQSLMQNGASEIQMKMQRSVKMNEKQKKCVDELKGDFERYQYVLENGSNDPLWSDGVNLNLIRNHIIYHKKIIENEFMNESYPAIYFQPTPDEVDDNFMVHEDMIRQKANQTLKKFNSFFYLDELKNASYYLEPKQLVEAGIQQSINRIHVLEQAIDEDDLVTMRRISMHENEYYEDLEKAFENLREINLEEDRQISFFEIMM